MPLTHDGIVIRLFCWKTDDLLKLINCYCLDAMFFTCSFTDIVISYEAFYVNGEIVASFNLLFV